MTEHLLERVWILLDIPVVNNDVSRCVVLTGRNGVGSGVFAEDHYFFGHEYAPLLLVTWCRRRGIFEAARTFASCNLSRQALHNRDEDS